MHRPAYKANYCSPSTQQSSCKIWVSLLIIKLCRYIYKPGAQHSENPIKALCCFRTGARAGGSARATCHSLSPRGEDKNSEGLTHEWVTQEGAHGNGRKEHNTREKRLHNGPQCSSANFPRVILFRLFSPLLFTSSRCPPPLHFKFKLVFASVGLSDKCQLICVLLLLPLFPKCGNAWLSSAETSAHERNIFLVLNNRHCARS